MGSNNEKQNIEMGKNLVTPSLKFESENVAKNVEAKRKF